MVLPDHEDRISTLPDDVLSSIISRLTFRDSVKTSILSSKWRYLCAAVSDINFDIEVMFGPNGNTTDIPNEQEIDILGEKDTCRKNKHAFVMGVNQFLNRYLGPKLHSLAVSFCFDADFTSDVDHWISLAVRMGVVVLDLKFMCIDCHHSDCTQDFAKMKYYLLFWGIFREHLT